MVIIKGTTPTLIFNFPFNVNDIDVFRVYVKQGNETVRTFTEADCIFRGKTICIELSEEDTFLLTSKKRFEAEARLRLPNGTIAGTKPVFVDVFDTGDDEILGNATGHKTVSYESVAWRYGSTIYVISEYVPEDYIYSARAADANPARGTVVVGYIPETYTYSTTAELLPAD